MTSSVRRLPSSRKLDVPLARNLAEALVERHAWDCIPPQLSSDSLTVRRAALGDAFVGAYLHGSFGGGLRGRVERRRLPRPHDARADAEEETRLQAFHAELFADGVKPWAHAGVYDLKSEYGVTEELWFPEWEFKGNPWDNPELYQKWSPDNFVKNFKTPTLVTHGELDFRVPINQGLELFTALQRRNIPSKMVYFPDEGHWVLKPQNSKLWYQTVGIGSISG